MRRQQILRINGLTAKLGIEIRAAGREAATLEDLVVGERHLGDIVRELVGVPAGLVVVPVHVDRTEDPQIVRQRKFMLEGMAGKDGVALLDIDPNLIFQPVALQEAVNGGDVEIILVLWSVPAASVR